MTFLANNIIRKTSTDAYCMSCHAHPNAEKTWRLSTHHDNPSGVKIQCVECHLPPRKQGFLKAKVKHGVHDAWIQLTKDPESINWEEKSRLENAIHFTYKKSCIRCHQILFPTTLSKEGDEAHLRCINCHLNVGHYSETAIHAKNVNFGKVAVPGLEIFTEPTVVKQFENFVEHIPGTPVSFKMVAIPEGRFSLGSLPDATVRKEDEGPVREVQIKQFWMAEIEVTWDAYLTFFIATESEGRTKQTMDESETDAISGATPPWGAPDQGWGKGSRPAITMSHYAARTFCRWVSQVTGKTYRLPTEAEWEYAARAGTTGPYFFEGDPKKLSKKRYLKKLSATDTANINAFVIYNQNSEGKTQEPAKVRPNPFGLKNMLGNVAEFCSDWYAPDAYAFYKDGIANPTGPASGNEHVVRGGSFKSNPADLRVASRDFTRNEEWLRTDPQIPKSIWWYSDCIHVGFRIVCEVPEDFGK